MKSGSILEAVARHEQALVARLDAAQHQADQTVADARAEAVRMREESRRTLEQEAADLRRQAEAAREEQREALQKAAAEELERRRIQAERRAPEVIQEVVSLILPKPTEGSR
jgi:vacuolar-type H+-ATPase subunit H